jgi:stearoyl-CoA desaturase (delta-9 desaturase)
MAEIAAPAPAAQETKPELRARVKGGTAFTPRPGRSLAWIVFQSVRGTWFLVAIHLGALAVLLTGTTAMDWAILPVFLIVRGLITTIGYHRYFSHRSFKTSRAGQFLLACLCCTNLQRGPLWWAAIHRHHHRHSDDPADAHSPVQHGFLWAYAGWMFATLEEPQWDTVSDLRRYPELVWLERFWLLPGLLLVALCWLAGGWSMVCLDFCLSAVVSLHGASVVNSLGHLIGSRRYPTCDSSRNSFLLALLTFGDGWHNNHHHYPHTAQAGFFPGEIDCSFRLIQALERLGLVWGVHRVPPDKLRFVE